MNSEQDWLEITKFDDDFVRNPKRQVVWLVHSVYGMNSLDLRYIVHTERQAIEKANDVYRTSGRRVVVQEWELDIDRPSEWISVDERFPSVNALGYSENVLTVFAGSVWHGETMPLSPAVRMGRYSEREDAWTVFSSYDGAAIVTHWMPLPDAP
jgi:hypothetical protein